MFVIQLIWIVPFLIFYIQIIYGAVSSSGFASPTATPFPPFFSLFGVSIMVTVMVLAFIMSPVLTSLQGLGSWAIARGVPFKEALAWSWARVRAHFMGWWWTGFVISIVSGMGGLACYVGALVTIPWAALAFAEIAAFEGDEWDN